MGSANVAVFSLPMNGQEQLKPGLYACLTICSDTPALDIHYLEQYREDLYVMPHLLLPLIP